MCKKRPADCHGLCYMPCIANPCSAQRCKSCVFAIASTTIVSNIIHNVGIVCDRFIICHVQASAACAHQMPLPLPASTTTSLQLRPQQDQYNDIAKFLGYSSTSSSLPSPHTARSSHTQASSQAALQAPTAAQSQTAGQTLRRPQEAVSHTGLYPNDHAMDLPASRPHRATPVSAKDSSQEAVQPEASSASSTSTSSQSSRSSHGHSGRRQAGGWPDRPVDRQAEWQSHSRPERQADRQPQSQPERQANGQPERQTAGQQYQTPVARVAASPFMADAEHSFLPTPVPPVNAFTSPFVADAERSYVPATVPPVSAEHSFVPSPAIAQQAAPSPWEAFTPATFPSQTPSPQHSTPSTRHSPAGHSSNSTGTHASPPTDYFSYLDLLGPQQAARLQPSSEQPHSTQLYQSSQAQMPHPHRQHRQHWQQQGQDRPQHASMGAQHAQRAGEQHANAQLASTQHAQRAGAQQHRQQHQHGRHQHQQDAGGRQADHYLRQAQLQQPQVRPSPFAQPSGPSQQPPTGSTSDNPLGIIAPTVPPRSAFDSFDTSGESQLSTCIAAYPRLCWSSATCFAVWSSSADGLLTTCGLASALSLMHAVLGTRAIHCTEVFEALISGRACT